MDKLNQDITLYKTILGGVSEAVFVFDDNGTILFANEAAYSELSYEDLSEIDISTIFPIVLPRTKDGVSVPAKGISCQTFAYKSNQTCYSVYFVCRQIGDGDRALYAAYAVNDAERFEAVVSHRKAMEEVEEANKMKNEFTANITHELRTPINGIKGMAEGLADTELSSEQYETVNIILHCCENMIKIINDILDFSKIEAGRMELDECEFSFGKFLNDTLSFHIGKINEKGLKLVVNVSGDIQDMLIGDELRIGQVLNNLFSNAIKFTSTGQIGLEVTGSREGNETELFFMVIDTGIGISPQEKDKLFRSFSQVDGSITRRFGGTGLGLAITKQLVTLMGGSINVESEKGKGSTFSFTVKLKNCPDKPGPVRFPTGSFVFTKNLPMASHIEPSSVITLAPGGTALSSSAVYTMGDGDSGRYMTGSYSDVTEPYTDVPYEETPGADMPGGDRQELDEIIEKLMISIELESWDKAEGFASLVKNRLSYDPELKRIAFSLLLNVRKENYELCVQELEKLNGRLSGG